MASLGNHRTTLDVSVTKNFGQRVQKKLDEVKKRCSPRLREIPQTKKPYYGPLPRKHPSIDLITHQQKHTKLEISTHVAHTNTKSDKVIESSQTTCDLENVDSMPATTELKVLDFGGVKSYVPHSRIDKTRVKETLRIYNKHYLHFFQEHNADENDGKRLAKHPDLKKEGVRETGGNRCINRPDLKAISKMLECKEVLFPSKRFGHLPGIDVGYQFYSRAEMVALGLHSHWLNGIDYMGQTYSEMEELKGYKFPLAVAIVLSGQYEDDQDNSEDIVYTGQGGNDFTGRKHQIKNQEMKSGNLALKNSKEQSIPVRVIRGHTDDHHFKIYTYDGLYEVSDCWPAEGVSGYIVYKYRLKRLKGQPKLTSNQVQYSNGRSSRVPVKAPQMV